MEQRNLVLAFVLSLAVLILWSAWMEQSGRRVRPSAPPQAEPVEPQRQPAASEAPDTTVAGSQPSEAREQRAPLRAHPEQLIQLRQPGYEARLTSVGAGLVAWQLGEYRTRVNGETSPIELSFHEAGEPPAFATPLEELGLGDLSRVPFAVVESGAEHVVFALQTAGLHVRKTYRLEGENYGMRIRLEIENGTERGVAPRFDLAWPVRLRGGPDYATTALVAFQAGEVESIDLRSFGTGGFFGSLTGKPPERSREVARDVTWAGVQTNYFLAALLPDAPRDARVSFEATEPGRRATLRVGYGAISVPAGHTAAREYRAFLGPKERERLEAAGGHLERSISLGWSWVSPLTRLFIWLLDVCYAVIPNYGLAIILLTVMVRLVTAPLLAKQMRSMKRLGEIQPQLRALQEKYADDRQRQSQEVMKLMRQSGANPLGGCLPMLFQFPFLIGLFWALQSSIHLRQAPFFGWIDDLSAPETLYTIPGVELPVRVLPLVMGASMVLQQRMTPSTMDPAQARMMMVVMPVMLTVISYQFPSGLVLYWFVSNLLAIAHQSWMNRKPKA